MNWCYIQWFNLVFCRIIAVRSFHDRKLFCVAILMPYAIWFAHQSSSAFQPATTMKVSQFSIVLTVPILAIYCNLYCSAAILSGLSTVLNVVYSATSTLSQQMTLDSLTSICKCLGQSSITPQTSPYYTTVRLQKIVNSCSGMKVCRSEAGWDWYLLLPGRLAWTVQLHRRKLHGHHWWWLYSNSIQSHRGSCITSFNEWDPKTGCFPQSRASWNFEPMACPRRAQQFAYVQLIVYT
jgi:hypothetical protein